MAASSPVKAKFALTTTISTIASSTATAVTANHMNDTMSFAHTSASTLTGRVNIRYPSLPRRFL